MQSNYVRLESIQCFSPLYRQIWDENAISRSGNNIKFSFYNGFKKYKKLSAMVANSYGSKETNNIYFSKRIYFVNFIIFSNLIRWKKGRSVKLGKEKFNLLFK